MWESSDMFQQKRLKVRAGLMDGFFFIFNVFFAVPMQNMWGLRIEICLQYIIGREL